MNIVKKAFLPAIAVVSMCGSLPAWADCTFAAGYSADTQESISFGNVVVPPATAVGKVVATKTSNLIASRGYFITGCTTFNQQDWRSPGLAAVTYGGEILYQSGVAGYAIRIVTPGAGSTAGAFGKGAFDRILTGNHCSWAGSTWTYCGGSWGPVTFELVKISATAGSGPMSTGTLVRASIRSWNYIYTARLASSSISNPACTVNSATIQVPLGDIEKRSFSGKGSTSPDRNFNIPLTCAAGARISFKLDATADSSAAPGVIALNATSPGVTASGVGVQVLYNTAPVTFGAITAAGTAAAAGGYSVPFIARYYQTQSNITPGRANALATFTMTYN
ncbi:hypothetical protein BSU01_04795 [Erwinia billingiae]|uniref:fimbrial protein n=1 Tax=Erwinia billingiae TaxID=182337 RepID=UPI0019CFF8C5|nr:fimbrial protein [Erwinia billingiae]MBN7121038.1 hypothetical protein [Erwinia billingiae]